MAVRSENLACRRQYSAEGKWARYTTNRTETNRTHSHDHHTLGMLPERSRCDDPAPVPCI